MCRAWGREPPSGVAMRCAPGCPTAATSSTGPRTTRRSSGTSRSRSSTASHPHAAAVLDAARRAAGVEDPGSCASWTWAPRPAPPGSSRSPWPTAESLATLLAAGAAAGRGGPPDRRRGRERPGEGPPARPAPPAPDPARRAAHPGRHGQGQRHRDRGEHGRLRGAGRRRRHPGRHRRPGRPRLRRPHQPLAAGRGGPRRRARPPGRRRRRRTLRDRGRRPRRPRRPVPAHPQRRRRPADPRRLRHADRAVALRARSGAPATRPTLAARHRRPLAAGSADPAPGRRGPCRWSRAPPRSPPPRRAPRRSPPAPRPPPTAPRRTRGRVEPTTLLAREDGLRATRPTDRPQRTTTAAGAAGGASAHRRRVRQHRRAARHGAGACRRGQGRHPSPGPPPTRPPSAPPRPGRTTSSASACRALARQGTPLTLPEALWVKDEPIEPPVPLLPASTAVAPTHDQSRLVLTVVALFVIVALGIGACNVRNLGNGISLSADGAPPPDGHRERTGRHGHPDAQRHARRPSRDGRRRADRDRQGLRVRPPGRRRGAQHRRRPRLRRRQGHLLDLRGLRHPDLRRPEEGRGRAARPGPADPGHQGRPRAGQQAPGRHRLRRPGRHPRRRPRDRLQERCHRHGDADRADGPAQDRLRHRLVHQPGSPTAAATARASTRSR